MRGDARHIEPVTVRWGDMDSMGHVNNAKYFTYCESARMSYFAAVRMTELREGDLHGPALAAAHLNFRGAGALPGGAGGRDPGLRDRPQQLPDGVRDLLQGHGRARGGRPRRHRLGGLRRRNLASPARGAEGGDPALRRDGLISGPISYDDSIAMNQSIDVFPGRAALVVAHPGHELRVHHWMERARPVVFVLTDGSGSAHSSRLASTTAVLEQAGARPGSIYGRLSDRDLYRALLDHGSQPFRELWCASSSGSWTPTASTPSRATRSRGSIRGTTPAGSCSTPPSSASPLPGPGACQPRVRSRCRAGRRRLSGFASPHARQRGPGAQARRRSRLPGNGSGSGEGRLPLRVRRLPCRAPAPGHLRVE